MIEKGLCPICGQKNNCFVVDGKDPNACWCMTTLVPKALLERVPNELRRQSCICKNCIETFNRSHNE